MSLCCFISQYSTCTLLQNDNFIRITFVGWLLSGGWQYMRTRTMQQLWRRMSNKSFSVLCNLSTDLLVFIKLKFLRILNSSRSFQEQMMTSSSCNYTFREKILLDTASKLTDFFLYQRSFYCEKYGAYISHELIVWLISTWIWYDLLIVRQIWSSNCQLHYFF